MEGIVILVHQYLPLGAFVLNAPFLLSSSTPARAGGRLTDSLIERLIGSEVVMDHWFTDCPRDR
jgi:hypothetical protein